MNLIAFSTRFCQILILLDLRLPKIDGLDVLAVIKSDPGLARIPVVIMTTSDAETDIAQAYDCHANSNVVKPFEFADFAALLESIGGYWMVWNERPF
jgi:CheY-like chemotaxis protein